MGRPKKQGYVANWRKTRGLVQLNCNIPWATKEKLDDLLNKTGQTTAEFIEDSITQLAHMETLKHGQ